MEEGAARRRGIVYRNRDSYGTAEGTQKLHPVSYAVHNLKWKLALGNSCRLRNGRTTQHSEEEAAAGRRVYRKTAKLEKHQYLEGEAAASRRVLIS